MPPRNWQVRLEDILEAIKNINDDMRGMDEKTFLANRQVRDAVVHNLTVMGEAVVHIPEEVQKKYPTLPWPEMKGIRNVLVHEYYKIEPASLWKTVKNDLPALEKALRDIFDKP